MKKIASNRKSGITAMSADNLFMILHFPTDGPVGTNARWMARQIFDEVVEELPPRLRRQILSIND
jgi:hypothetical protein